MMLYLYIVFLLFIRSNSGVRQGQIPESTESPWKISLQKQNVFRHWNGTKSHSVWFHFCGATLIASKIVYTAGHCVQMVKSSLHDGEPVRAVAGEYNVWQNDSTEQYGEIAEFWMENGYDLQIGAGLLEILLRVGTNVKLISNLPKPEQLKISNSYAKAVNMDHGLLFLKNPFNICSKTSNVKIAFLSKQKYNKGNCTVTGWGQTGDVYNYDGKPRRAKLKTLEAIGAHKEALRATFHGKNAKIPTTLCNGDSGSGVICYSDYGERILAGAFSTFLYEPKPTNAEKCQTALEYSMLTDAQKHIRKIYDVIKTKNLYYSLKVDQMRCSENVDLLVT